MAIEVRNISPINQSTDVSIWSDIEFYLVGLEGDTIDIDTLSVEIEMVSTIDGEARSVIYTPTSDAISYTGNNLSYNVILNPIQPFEYGQTVTIKINVDTNTPESMDEFEISFTTYLAPLISDFRCAFISEAERIPVYQEKLRKIDSQSEPTKYDSAFQRWNPKPVPKIEVNQVLFLSSDTTYGHSIDYQNGIVTFDSANAYNDEIWASYTFSFFTDEQIESYFQKAIGIWSLYPPFGGPSSIYEATFPIRAAIMIGAAVFAFRDLIFSLAFQERRIIFDKYSWNDWSAIKDVFQSLLAAYTEDWKNALESKKFQLPQIASIVTPEYTLPGGRSRFFRYLYKGGN